MNGFAWSSLLLLLATWPAALAMGEEPAKQPASQPSAVAKGLELVLLDEGGMFRLEILMEMDGQPSDVLWNKAFDRLLAFIDRDGSGRLEESEAARLPSAFGMRQVLGAGFAPMIGRAPDWKALDANDDGGVDREELADFYRRSGSGAAMVGVGRLPATDKLTDVLLQRLDLNEDQRVVESEWRAAAETLLKLDGNDDELVGAGELAPKTLYPGASGAATLGSPSLPDAPSSSQPAALPPLVVLPARKADVDWATAIVALRDGDADGALSKTEASLPADAFARLDADQDGQLKDGELAVWRELPPDARWLFRFGERNGRPAFEDLTVGAERQAGRLAAVCGRLKVEARSDEGKLTEASAAARRHFTADFTATDSNRDGFVDRDESRQPNQGGFALLLDHAGLNGDGKLGERELESWLDLQQEIARCQALVTVLDCGQGLFELLGAVDDGALSIRELRGAWAQVSAAQCLKDGKLDRTALPRLLLFSVSHGYPVELLGPAQRGGPSWFLAMDRNGDGDVSQREFTGQTAAFDKLDQDRDGLISQQEAEQGK
jgi:hypothetical protein